MTGGEDDPRNDARISANWPNGPVLETQFRCWVRVGADCGLLDRFGVGGR